MVSLVKWMRRVLRPDPWKPLQFPTAGFEEFPASEVLEEEFFHEFKKGDYYPVNIGDLLDSDTYQVVGKLGFGRTSSVWLARDLRARKYVALKIFTRWEGETCRDEFQTCKAIEEAGHSHKGRSYLRTALDQFTIDRPGGLPHHCLVQKPLWDTWGDLLYRNPNRRFSQALLKVSLQQLLSALDYLHTECKLVHTDISEHNILHSIVDKDILKAYVKEEFKTPTPRKHVTLDDGTTVPVYASHRFGMPKHFGHIVLSDFGEAVRGDVKHNHHAQPNQYRAPEVQLGASWSYPIDIWNVGCLIWSVFEGRHLFRGRDPVNHRYSTRAHLAEVVALLGPPPLDLLRRGWRSKEFFSEDGQWIANVTIPRDNSLEKAEHFLTGSDKTMFLNFVRGMLAWRPEDRKTARELLKDPWLNAWEDMDD
ncbi:CMGC protein kinase [Chaetomium strumarium]|uniref:CMGC protein kinase n=1 Tax=Chaetomium strumarium TaxID=1170767 RepID=A0AAJ0M766_9PEZI|nr:CMGC protein kinase [Chaetomium strumarium]